MTPSAPLFSLSVEQHGPTTLLRLVGELDLATVPQLSRTAERELDRPDCRDLVLDLADLDFVDSTGIGCWVQIRTRALAGGRRVVLRSVPLQVRRVLELGALDVMLVEGAQPDPSAPA